MSQDFLVYRAIAGLNLDAKYSIGQSFSNFPLKLYNVLIRLFGSVLSKVLRNSFV